MKTKYIKTLLVAGMFITGTQLTAQGPPDPPGNPSTSGGPVGGSAPITGGIGILLALGAAYGSKKVYNAWRQHTDTLEA